MQALRVVALQARERVRDIIGRGLAEAGDAHVAVAGLKIRLLDAAYIDLGAAQGEGQQLAAGRAPHREFDGAARGTAHAIDRAGEIRSHIHAVDAAR